MFLWPPLNVAGYISLPGVYGCSFVSSHYLSHFLFITDFNSSFFLQSHFIFANDEHSHHQTSEAIWRYKIARWKSWLESWNLQTMQLQIANLTFPVYKNDINNMNVIILKMMMTMTDSSSNWLVGPLINIPAN